jgi:hypothetical protein
MYIFFMDMLMIFEMESLISCRPHLHTYVHIFHGYANDF